jgi:transcriptional regulator with XRE-family HTH domain
MIFDISAAQLRARALLDWELATLAEKSGVSVSTICRYESKGPAGQHQLVRAVLKTLNERGVEFIPGGVRETKTTSETA